MLYFVLILVLAALGLLVVALVAASAVWAWISVGVSVGAGVVLVLDFFGRRSRRSKNDAKSGEEAAEPAHDEPKPDGTKDDAIKQDNSAATDLLPTTGTLGSSAAEAEDQDEKRAGEVGSSAQRDIEVFVVDEHPHYHLSTCRWVIGRDLIPLPVDEARELGFTACDLCAPDTTSIQS